MREAATALPNQRRILENRSEVRRRRRRLRASEDADRASAQRRRPERSLLLDAAICGRARTRHVMRGAEHGRGGDLLGIEAMTGHWEFTYGETALRGNLERFKGEFLAPELFSRGSRVQRRQGVRSASGRLFKPP